MIYRYCFINNTTQQNKNIINVLLDITYGLLRSIPPDINNSIICLACLDLIQLMRSLYCTKVLD